METAGKHVDRESKAYEKLKGEKRHFCPDWDFMAIDETCSEFESCTCYPEVEVSFPDGKRKVPAHFDASRPERYTPNDMEGWEFMEVLGGGWYGFQV